jgi:hypothetical protein
MNPITNVNIISLVAAILVLIQVACYGLMLAFVGSA